MALVVAGTDFIQMPAGTTAQRPPTPVQGMQRYNTTLGYTEVYTGTAWVQADLPAAGTSGNVLTSNGTTWTSAALPSTAPTTAQVLSATAGLTAGAVGTYAFLDSNVNSATSFGGTTAGSNLRPSNAGKITEFIPQSGTWRCVGYIGGDGTAQMNSTLLVRIS